MSQKSMSALAAACLASALVLGAPEAMSQANNPAANDIMRDTTASRALKEYWTEDRLKNAEPVPLPTLETPNALKKFKKRALPGADKMAAKSNAVDLQAAGQPVPAPTTKHPYVQAGALFFNLGGDKICTAQFVTPRILITAAHCVRDHKTGNWATKVQFCQGFANGKCTKIFDGPCFTTKQGWVSEEIERYNYDYAFVKVRGTSKTGHLGYWFNNVPYNAWASIGYPANYGNNRVMHVVVGSKGEIYQQIVQMKGNPMGPGSSGGAWIGALGSDNYVISVNSFGLENDKTSTYGPALNKDTVDLLDYTNRECR